jgi:hypothetical protein
MIVYYLSTTKHNKTYKTYKIIADMNINDLIFALLF